MMSMTSSQDMMSGNILTDRPLSVPGLQYEDALTISRMARHVQRLDKQVSSIRILFFLQCVIDTSHFFGTYLL